MTKPFAFNDTEGNLPELNEPPRRLSRAGYTRVVKNGQHSETSCRSNPPASGRARWQVGGLIAGALIALPTTAFADPPPDDGEVRIDLDADTMDRVRAAAEKAAQDVMNAAASRPAQVAAAPKADSKKSLSPDAAAQRAIVTIERGGQPVGLGTVLAGDGRVLTALSSLGSGNDLDVRYADGHTSRVKVGHHDRAWDLALLVPQTGKWVEGLSPSPRDPVRDDATIRSFSGTRGKVVSVPMSLRSRTGLLGGDDKILKNAIEIGSRVASTDLGAPILDDDGRVAGVVARGCAPAAGDKPCTPAAYGVPVAAIRSFLHNVPDDAVQPTAWLGIQGIADATPFAKGVRVLGVHPESPADAAKIEGGDGAQGDLILAVDGEPVTNPEALAEAVRKHGVGDKVPVLLFGEGKYQLVDVVLRALPDVADGSDADSPAQVAAPEKAVPPQKATRIPRKSSPLPPLPGRR